MKILRNTAGAFAFLMLFSAGIQAFADNGGTIGRFALIIGKNDGGQDRVMLRFAATDAMAFSTVLQEMGGLEQSRQVLLIEPSFTQIQDGFARIGDVIKNEQASLRRSEFIVYYSGHSDETGLLLGGQTLSYSDLRRMISGVPADVRIAIIDSCASGVFIRTKGGTRQPPFLVDSSTEMKGYAFLTSSSENEAAQESDRVGASFFTHYLVSGMRGGADATLDGVVTLNEAYHYAFTETLAQTEKTQYGAQHPSYDIQLSGTGDLVLTDLRVTSSSVVFAEQISGQLFIRNSRGDLVVELKKTAGAPMEIGLAPGSYTVLVETPDALYQASLGLSAGKHTRLEASAMQLVTGEATIARGDIKEKPSLGNDGFIRRDPFEFSLLPALPASGLAPVKISSLSLNLTVGNTQRIEGAMLSSIGSMISDGMSGVSLSGVFNIGSGDIKGGMGAGVFNIASDELRGVQFGGVFNMAGDDLTGAQVSGVWSACAGNLSGAQIAGVFNIAQDIRGVQISGFVNRANDVQGAQIGVFNSGNKITGVQVGIINISEENTGAAIGLFNFSSNGIHDFECWTVPDGFMNLAFKFGTEYFYSIFMGGMDVYGDTQAWQAGIGWGAHLPIDRFYADADAIMTSVHNSIVNPGEFLWEKSLLGHIRLKAGFDIFEMIGVFAGVDFQFYTPRYYYDSAKVANAIASFPFDELGPCSVVPEFFFGIRFLK